VFATTGTSRPYDRTALLSAGRFAGPAVSTRSRRPAPESPAQLNTSGRPGFTYRPMTRIPPLGSPGYDGQPAVYSYIAALEVNVLNCRDESALSLPWPGPAGRSRLTSCVAWAS
jgi:hypothetical protein